MSDEKTSKEIEDMSLDSEEKHPEPLDMDLSGPDSTHVGVRIQKLFPDVDMIDLIDDLKIMKMADGSYTVRGRPLQELATMDLQKIDTFLKEKEGEK